MNRTDVLKRQVQIGSGVLYLLSMLILLPIAGESGIAYLALAISLTLIVSEILGGSAANALSRLLRVSKQKGQHKNADKIRKSVLSVQVLAGILGMLLLLLFGRMFLEGVFDMQYASVILIILIPAVLFRALSGVFLGCLQADGNHLMGVIVTLLRPLCMLTFGLFFGGLCKDYGVKVSGLLLSEQFASMYAGIGISCGISITELFSVVALAIASKGIRDANNKMSEDGMRYTDSFLGCVKPFLYLRTTDSILFLLGLLPLGTSYFILRLAQEDTAKISLIYGTWICAYLAFCVITVLLAYVPIVSVPTSGMVAAKKNDYRYMRSLIGGGFHITIVKGLLITVALAVLADSIAEVLPFALKDMVLGMLQSGSVFALFLLLDLYQARILILSGKKGFLSLTMLAANVVFGLSLFLFERANPSDSNALIYAGLIASGSLCVVFFAYISKHLRVRINWITYLVLPIAAACVSGLIMLLASKVLMPHVDPWAVVFVVYAIGCGIYWAILKTLGNFSEQEREVLPLARLRSNLVKRR